MKTILDNNLKEKIEIIEKPLFFIFNKYQIKKTISFRDEIIFEELFDFKDREFIKTKYLLYPEIYEFNIYNYNLCKLIYINICMNNGTYFKTKKQKSEGIVISQYIIDKSIMKEENKK